MNLSWLKKLGFGFLVAFATIFISNIMGNLIIKPRILNTEKTVNTPPNNNKMTALLKPISSKYSSETEKKINLKSGQKIFTSKCSMCHSKSKPAPNKIGPGLFGVFGKTVGSSKNFKYSHAMKNSNKKWNSETLDIFLQNPKKSFPGTKMSFSGLKKQVNRSQVITYLKNLK